MEEIKAERPTDISRACRIMGTSRSSMSYKSVKDDLALMERLQKLAVDHPREGFWKCHYRIRNSGEIINHKRLHRVYKMLGLPMRRKHKKRLPARTKEPLEVPTSFTHTWSMDFMSDALEGGRKFRTFNIIDDYNREVLFIETDYALKSSRVLWVLKHLVKRHGRPSRIRMDNGPEFIAEIAKSWSETNDIEFKYIQPGKPMQNAYIERFNGSFRNGVLDAHLFQTIEEVREVTAEWVHDYNHFRPHDSLKGKSPVAYREANNNLLVLPSGLRSASATPSLHSAQREEQNQELIIINENKSTFDLY